jgi:hypothetical protein
MTDEQFEEFGVEAIVYLQKMAGIEEPPERARLNWQGFSEWERATTINTYCLMSGKEQPHHE